MDLEKVIRDIPDFPKEGIVFKDITPLLKDPVALKEAHSRIADHFKDKEIDLIAGAESRGFIFGMGVAMLMGVGFVPIRKPGKLPYTTHSESYDLEYGSDSLEVHTDAFSKGQKVLLIDDLLATGGTMSACEKLVEKCGAEVAGCAFLIELAFLNGREKLKTEEVFSVLKY